MRASMVSLALGCIDKISRSLDRQRGVRGNNGSCIPARLEFGGVTGGPVEKCPRWCSCNLFDRACEMRRLADCGGPGIEQHIHDERRHGPLAPRLVRRDLFDPQRAAEDLTDGGDLLKLAQGLKSG